MNDMLYMLKFNYDIIFGQSYVLIPRQSLDIKSIINNIKMAQQPLNTGKNK